MITIDVSSKSAAASREWLISAKGRGVVTVAGSLAECLSAALHWFGERQAEVIRVDVEPRSNLGIFDADAGWIGDTAVREDVWGAEAKITIERICFCDLATLMREGCRCGAIIRYAGGIGSTGESGEK
jgi:hypothetical protein